MYHFSVSVETQKQWMFSKNCLRMSINMSYSTRTKQTHGLPNIQLDFSIYKLPIFFYKFSAVMNLGDDHCHQ